MARSPDSITRTFRELSDAEEQAVDDLEVKIDLYLDRNYYPEGSCTYAPMEPYNIHQLREICARYRLQGWRVLVLGTVEDPVLYFFKSDGEYSEQEITRIKSIA